MDLEITDLLKLDLGIQARTIMRYGDIIVDISFLRINTRKSIVVYKGQAFIITIQDGEVVRVTKTVIPKETFQ